jgi:hydroxyacylglutathione hydrolase
MKNWTTKTGTKIFRILQGRCNCFLITKDNKYLLVDTGRANNWGTLCNNLETLGVSVNSSIHLVLTHCHFDHAENAASIKEKYKALTIVHSSESICLANGENPSIVGSTLFTKLLTNRFIQPIIHDHFRYKPALFDVLVEEKYDLDSIGISGYILHTPGHSPGSISIIVDDEIAIVGDAMFGIFRGSIFPPFALDTKLMVKSWKKLLDTGCATFLPAHGSERTRDVLKSQYNKYAISYDL